VTFVGLHLSRFAEEITLFATAEFNFVTLPEAFSTGSSAMPQKKNPDLTELIRAKVGRINGAAQTVTLLLKGLPLAYNKDMQETQEPAFAVEFVPKMITLVARFTAALQFNRVRMNEAAQSGYLNAMAAATYLVHKGVPFRTAHEKIGNAVRYAIEKGVELNALSLDELRQFGEEFGEDFFAAVTLEATLDCHDVIGGTARECVHKTLTSLRKHLAELPERPKKQEAADAGA
jgi:argininosuccinate lyase